MIFAHLQILIIQKSCRSQNFDFSTIFDILALEISKMEEKIKIPASTSFLHYSNL